MTRIICFPIGKLRSGKVCISVNKHSYYNNNCSFISVKCYLLGSHVDKTVGWMVVTWLKYSEYLNGGHMTRIFNNGQGIRIFIVLIGLLVVKWHDTQFSHWSHSGHRTRIFCVLIGPILVMWPENSVLWLYKSGDVPRILYVLIVLRGIMWSEYSVLWVVQFWSLDQNIQFSGWPFEGQIPWILYVLIYSILVMESEYSVFSLVQ